MRFKIYNLSAPEVQLLIDNCISDPADVELTLLAHKRMSDAEIATTVSASLEKVTRQKRRILKKIFCFLEESNEMTTIFIDGKPVKKVDIENYEIKLESDKKAIKNKLT